MRYLVILLLLTGCAKTATESATETALAQVAAVEHAIKKECPQAKIDDEMCALKSAINTQMSACEERLGRADAEKEKWQIIALALGLFLAVGIYLRIKK